MPRGTPRSSKELRAEFLRRHKEWSAVNDYQGIVSGKEPKAWKRRLDILMKLVRAGERERKARK